MKSPTEYLSLKYKTWRVKGFGILLVVLLIIIGFILALLTFKLGFLALPVVIFLFLIFPWLIQDPFRLFIWLIVTWPILTLYARFPLPAGIPDITYERILLLLILSFVLIEGLFSRKNLHKIGLFGILAGIFVIAQLITRAHVLWYGGIGDPDLDGVLRIVLIPLAMYWLTKQLIVSRWHLKWLLYALILASMIICITGLIDFALGQEKTLFAVPQVLGGFANIRYMDVPGGRAAGVMGNPGIYGAILGMGVLISLACLNHAEHNSTKIFLILTIFILLLGVFASYTRAAWISLIVALFIVQFFMENVWRKTLPIFFIGFLLLALAWGSLVDNPLMLSRVLNPENVFVRIELGQFAWEKFLEKPFMGWGYGAFNRFGLMSLGFSSHNTYLSLLVDGGLFLLLSFIAVPAYLIYEAFRINKMIKINTFTRDILAALTGCFLIFLLSGLVRELNYFGYFFTYVMIIGAVIEIFKAGKVMGDGKFEINMLTQSMSRKS